ncbi:MAG: hypothetical protein HC869_15330 [Rhodospirillales bacterium]|nr:hypothetical protein [Rhodospirillales bacterium]
MSTAPCSCRAVPVFRSEADEASRHGIPEAMQLQMLVFTTNRIKDDGLQMARDSHATVLSGKDRRLPDCSFRAPGLCNTGIAS